MRPDPPLGYNLDVLSDLCGFAHLRVRSNLYFQSAVSNVVLS